MCMLGTFSEFGTISEHSAVKVDPDLPLDKVVLIGCGVPTGFGSAGPAAAPGAGGPPPPYRIGGGGRPPPPSGPRGGARDTVGVQPPAPPRRMTPRLDGPPPR